MLKIYCITLHCPTGHWQIKRMPDWEKVPELCKVEHTSSNCVMTIYVRAADVRDAFNLAINAFEVGG